MMAKLVIVICVCIVLMIAIASMVIVWHNWQQKIKAYKDTIAELKTIQMYDRDRMSNALTIEVYRPLFDDNFLFEDAKRSMTAERYYELHVKLSYIKESLGDLIRGTKQIRTADFDKNLQMALIYVNPWQDFVKSWEVKGEKKYLDPKRHTWLLNAVTEIYTFLTFTYQTTTIDMECAYGYDDFKVTITEIGSGYNYPANWNVDSFWSKLSMQALVNHATLNLQPNEANGGKIEIHAKYAFVWRAKGLDTTLRGKNRESY